MRERDFEQPWLANPRLPAAFEPFGSSKLISYDIQHTGEPSSAETKTEELRNVVGWLKTGAMKAHDWEPSASSVAEPLQGSFAIVTGVVRRRSLIGALMVDTRLQDQHSERSSTVSEDKRLERMVSVDANALWEAITNSLSNEEEIEVLQREYDAFVHRHEARGIRALSSLLLGRLPSGETAWTLVRFLGEGPENEAYESRKDVLAAALASRDAGLRYAAAAALGQLQDQKASDTLRNRLMSEKNISVRRMIQAELRK